jgi:hypothetical protein
MIIHPLDPGQPLVSKTANATLDDDYIVPIKHITHVIQIDLCNKTSTARWISIQVRGKALFSQYVIPGRDTISWSGFHALEAGDKIQTQAEVAAAVDVLISGTQKKVST